MPVFGLDTSCIGGYSRTAHVTRTLICCVHLLDSYMLYGTVECVGNKGLVLHEKHWGRWRSSQAVSAGVTS